MMIQMLKRIRKLPYANPSNFSIYFPRRTPWCQGTRNWVIHQALRKRLCDNRCDIRIYQMYLTIVRCNARWPCFSRTWRGKCEWPPPSGETHYCTVAEGNDPKWPISYDVISPSTSQSSRPVSLPVLSISRRILSYISARNQRLCW